MRGTRWIPSIALMIAPLAGCLLPLSEQGTLELSTQPLFRSSWSGPESGSKVLQGSQLCVDISAIIDNEVHILGAERRCYSVTLNGEPWEHDQCRTLDQLGEVLFEYTPLESCPLEELDGRLVPDRYRLEVVPADGLQAQMSWWHEEAAEQLLHPGPRGSFPVDWLPADGEPLQMVPGSRLSVSAMLVDPTGDLVAWDKEQGQAYKSRDEGSSWTPTPSSEDDDSLFILSIEDGERRQVELRLPQLEVPLIQIVATPAAAAQSLEIVVGYDPGPAPEVDGWHDPMGARAVVRDSAGHVIVGAPVEWTLVEGHLVAENDAYIQAPPEYLGIADQCDPPPEVPTARRAVLRAQLGTLVDEVELEWTAVPPRDPPSEPFEPHELCQRGVATAPVRDRGCRCTSGDSGGSGAWWALGILVAVRRTRRRRPAR